MTDNVAMAAYYRMTAVVFWENAKMLRATFEADGKSVVGNRMAIPFYYLVSHAAELLLKCALLKRGVSSSELKTYPLRHSLDKLLCELRNRSVPITERSVQLLRALNQQHEKHALKYTAFVDDGEPTFTPEPNELFSVLDELLMAGRIVPMG